MEEKLREMGTIILVNLRMELIMEKEFYMIKAVMLFKQEFGDDFNFSKYPHLTYFNFQ